MKNKSTIMIVISAAIAMAAMVLYYTTTRTSVVAASADLEMLRAIKSGLRSLEIEDNSIRGQLAKSGKDAMESFLERWNPIGRTPGELKSLFGKPKEEGSDYLLYAFDNGSYASLFQFAIRNGRVVELTRPMSE